MARLTQMMNQKRADLQAARLNVFELERDLSRLEAAQKSMMRASAELDPPRFPFSQKEYARYGRQMILPQVGVDGQRAFESSKLLVVGAGGLGCPVLQYLAAAGVGHVTILDHDHVELSNLHRQVLHSEATVGINKAESARLSLARLNSDIVVEAHPLAFTPSLFAAAAASSTPSNVLKAEFDLVLDCTDNPATRHFLNAYAVAHKIPLVSGGAVRTEGTVGVYNLPLSGTSTSLSGQEEVGPCYACLFPPAPSQGTISDEQAALLGTGACSDEGVLGVLCGVVGLVMASEAMKVLLGTAKPTMHLLNPLSPTPVRTIKVRARQPSCPGCSHASSSKWNEFISGGSGDWPGWEDPLCAVAGVGSRAMADEPRIAPEEVEEAMAERGLRLIDIRRETEFAIASLEGSRNLPLARLLKDPAAALALFDEPSDPNAPGTGAVGPDTSKWPIYFVCRRGNDSLIAARALRRHLAQTATAPPSHSEDDPQPPLPPLEVGDLRGGLVGWTEDVDPEFPLY